jgi:hypothetical protein
VDAMLAGMTASEYVHWQAIYETEPFPEERADRRAAEIIQASLLGRVKELPTIADLMPDYWGTFHVKQSPEQMQANIKLIKAAAKRKKK